MKNKRFTAKILIDIGMTICLLLLMPYSLLSETAHAKKMIFPIGEPNDKFAQYFTGKSFLAPVSTSQVGIFNVTFEPGCRNNWHIHHAKSGGGQILICIAGRGYYQEEGKEMALLLNLHYLQRR